MEIKDDQDATTTPSDPPIGFTNVVLKACVIAIAKTCALIWEEMRKGQVYEEEDFMTNKFGVSMYESFPLSSMVAMLDQADHWMDRTGTPWIVAHEGDDASAVISAVKDRILHARVRISFFFAAAAKLPLFCSKKRKIDKLTYLVIRYFNRYHCSRCTKFCRQSVPSSRTQFHS